MLVNLLMWEEVYFYVDVLDVPEFIANDLENYCSQAVDWLMDKRHNHEFWAYSKPNHKGKKVGVLRCSDSFIFWVNEILLKGKKEFAKIVKRDLRENEYDKSLPTVEYS